MERVVHSQSPVAVEISALSRLALAMQLAVERVAQCLHISYFILTQVSLIDFTASRLVSEGSGQLAFYDLSQDPEVFEGTQGDVQVRGRGISHCQRGGDTAGRDMVLCFLMHVLWLVCLWKVAFDMKVH